MCPLAIIAVLAHGSDFLHGVVTPLLLGSRLFLRPFIPIWKTMGRGKWDTKSTSWSCRVGQNGQDTKVEWSESGPSEASRAACFHVASVTVITAPGLSGTSCELRRYLWSEYSVRYLYFSALWYFRKSCLSHSGMWWNSDSGNYQLHEFEWVL